MTAKIFRNAFLIGFTVLLACMLLFFFIMYSNYQAQAYDILQIEAAHISEGMQICSGEDYLAAMQSDERITWIAPDGSVLTGVTADGVEFTKAWVLNWDKVAQASWFAIPKLMPVKIVFDMRAILPVMIMFVVTAVETVGDISGVMEGGMDREPTDKELSGGVICDGLGSTFAALFGVLPNTSFSQNVGLVAMTKVVNRMALASGAIFLILCGLIPKLGALISIMPQAVLGGAAVMMFSSIVVSGIQLITKEKMTPRQLTIVSVALGVGYGMGANSGILAQAPHAFQLICGESGIVPAAFVAILLNVLLPKDDKAA